MTNFPENKNYTLENFAKEYIDLLSAQFQEINFNTLDKIANAIIESAENGTTIFTCGNGGSSSIAEHLVCDFVKGISTNTNIYTRVFSLLSTPLLTAIANDISYEDVFSFQIDRYGKEGDILFCVSSSGNSENVVKAIQKAKSKGLLTISFVGFNGGKAREESDLAMHIPINNYGLVEDSHHILMHILAQFIRFKSICDAEDIKDIKF